MTALHDVAKGEEAVAANDYEGAIALYSTD